MYPKLTRLECSAGSPSSFHSRFVLFIIYRKSMDVVLVKYYSWERISATVSWHVPGILFLSLVRSAVNVVVIPFLQWWDDSCSAGFPMKSSVGLLDVLWSPDKSAAVKIIWWISNRSYGSIVVNVKTITMQHYPPNLMFNNDSTDYFLCGIQMEPYNLLDLQQMTSRLKDHPLSTLKLCQISLPLWATLALSRLFILECYRWWNFENIIIPCWTRETPNWSTHFPLTKRR